MKLLSLKQIHVITALGHLSFQASTEFTEKTNEGKKKTILSHKSFSRLKTKNKIKTQPTEQSKEQSYQLLIQR